ALKEKAMMREQVLKERQISERKMVEQKLKASRITESQMRMKSITEQTQIRGKTGTPAGGKSGVFGAKTEPLAGGRRLGAAAGGKASLVGAKDVLSTSDFAPAKKRPSKGTGAIALPSAISKSSSKTQKFGSRTPAPTPTVVQHVPSIKPSPAAKKEVSKKIPTSVYSAPAAFSKRTKDMPPPKAVADIQPSRQTYSAKAADALEARPPGAPKGPNVFSYNDVFKDVPSKPQPQRSTSASASSGKVKAPSLAEV
ncbi:unnamed protein product, partial [marine sediment metagenome]